MAAAAAGAAAAVVVSKDAEAAVAAAADSTTSIWRCTSCRRSTSASKSGRKNLVHRGGRGEHQRIFCLSAQEMFSEHTTKCTRAAPAVPATAARQVTPNMFCSPPTGFRPKCLISPTPQTSQPSQQSSPIKFANKINPNTMFDDPVPQKEEPSENSLPIGKEMFWPLEMVAAQT